MKRVMVTLCAAVMMSAVFIGGPAGAQTVATAENLLVSTEMLLISEANLSILALNLIETNMEHDYTTVEEDKAALDTIVESVTLSGSTLDALLQSDDIAEGDMALLKLLATSNQALNAAAQELSGYCEDGDKAHFSNFVEDMQIVVKAMEKVGKLMK